MSNFFKASIGKKVIMSVTGLFLILFLLVHLAVNALLLFGPEVYNPATEFMATNPAIKIMEPVLAAGFLFHILYSIIVTLENRRARGKIRYKVVDQRNSSTWQSRNMFVLGSLIFVFLAIHLLNFFYPMKFVGLEHVQLKGTQTLGVNAYDLVVHHFKIWYYVILYVIGGVLLIFHLTHGFWSSFQSLGWSNDIWRKRLTVIGNIYAWIVGLGFALIPLYFFLLQYV